MVSFHFHGAGILPRVRVVTLRVAVAKVGGERRRDGCKRKQREKKQTGTS
jgi:hypothetical protein